MRAALTLLLALVLVAVPVGAAGGETFELCRTGSRQTCVVDGDTIRWRGESVRILNIDTPEITGPGCAEEAALGFAAADRLLALLNAAGAWELRRDPAEPRDVDRYGRALRLLVIDGRDAGEQLVAEGLARPWTGRRESWCG